MKRPCAQHFGNLWSKDFGWTPLYYFRTALYKLRSDFPLLALDALGGDVIILSN